MKNKMLHNIFKRTRKKKVKKTPLIIADVHEKNSLVISELHRSKQVRLEIRSLKIGDYVIGNVIVERKTVSDLISSMINKRLIQQLNQMSKYDKSLLIIEGDLDEVLDEDNNIAKAVRGLILSICVNNGIPVIYSNDYEDTAKYLITLARQQVKPNTIISFH